VKTLSSVLQTSPPGLQLNQKINRVTFCFVLLSFVAIMDKNELADTSHYSIHLHISGIQEARGSLRIAMFDNEESFLNTPNAIYLKVLEVNDTLERKLSIPNLPEGDYAVAVFHDLNKNGRLNTNWLGIPTEPYAFSNDAGRKWKKPGFEDARFSLKEHSKVVELRLRSWKEY
jgi:uncharacterized protein (DUF2141 family)